MQVITNPLWF